MSHRSILQRIHEAVGRTAYLTPVGQVDPRQREVLLQLSLVMQGADFDRDLAEALVERGHEDGRLDAVMRLSALAVIATHPGVRDYRRAFELASRQEQAALDLGGSRLSANLASADRHRGVLAFLMGRHEVALEWFTAALEKERSAENLGNVLAALLKLGELDDARQLYEDVLTRFPSAIAEGLSQIVDWDDDLASLRGS